MVNMLAFCVGGHSFKSPGSPLPEWGPVIGSSEACLER